MELDIRYARSSGAAIAHQVVGSGPTDLVLSSCRTRARQSGGLRKGGGELRMPLGLRIAHMPPKQRRRVRDLGG